MIGRIPHRLDDFKQKPDIRGPIKDLTKPVCIHVHAHCQILYSLRLSVANFRSSNRKDFTKTGAENEPNR